MTKKEALNHWRSLPAALNPMEHMEAIPYKTRGSRYGACGVRIDGSPEFVDAVLSCLKSMLAGESVHTRLELARRLQTERALPHGLINLVLEIPRHPLEPRQPIIRLAMR